MNKKISRGRLAKILPGLKTNVSLAQHTTFRIGGPAKYFFAAKTTSDVIKAIRTAKKLKLPFFVLGQGSNLLVSDKGFNGLVVKIQNSKFKIQNSRLYAEAGISFSVLVYETGKRGLAGLEWAGGLPGTLGGAVRGNAGAFGGETKDSVVEVEAFDHEGRRRKFSGRECQFAYRSSIFKKKGYIVLAATMQLRKGSKAKIQAVAKEHMRYRKERHPLEYPSAGSIFKNCDLKKPPATVQVQFKDVIKTDPFPVIPAAALIARAKLQGMRVGDAEISEKHPNYIVNRGNATANDVLELIARVKKEIKNKFSIDLEEE